MERTETRIKGIHLVTDIYGDGQKPWYLVLEYERALAPESVSAKDYEVKDRKIEAVYTNTEPELPEKSVEGSYVLLVLSTDYMTPCGSGCSSRKNKAFLPNHREYSCNHGSNCFHGGRHVKIIYV